MADVSNAAELANFFMVAISIVFGVWYDRTEQVLLLKRPLAYVEREPYARTIFWTLLGRSSPMWAVMIAFLVAFAPVTLHLLRSSTIGLSTNVDAASTVYCLMYWFLAYLFVMMTVQLWGLTRKLRQSGEGSRSKPAANSMAVID